MKTFNMEISEQLVDYIERLNFEVNAKERIVKTMLGDSSYENLMENENFLKYQERYEVAFTEYEMAKREVEAMIPKHFREGHQLSWNIDFATKVFSITFNCNCFDDVDNLSDYKGE